MRLFLGKHAYLRHSTELSSLGYTPIALEPLDRLNRIVSDHADTLIFDCGELLAAVELADTPHRRAIVSPYGNYPDDIKLNALALGGCVFGRLASLSPELLALADERGLRRVNVRQGYARCSVLPLYGDSSRPDTAITADRGLADAMRKYSLKVLEISPGSIALEGCEYGFIGGASVVDRCARRVIFYGSLDSHPDCKSIRDFCTESGYDTLELAGALTDLGGGVIVS